MHRLAMAAAVFFLGMSTVTAEPEVLLDTGQTISIDPYLELITPRKATPEPAPSMPPLSLPSYGLPIETPSMTPGKVDRRALPTLQGKMAGVSPLFLVGADRWSVQWLQQNREHLLRLSAVGIIVAAKKEQELAILRQAAQGLRLYAMSAEAIASEHGIRHYPALIAPPGIVVQ